VRFAITALPSTYAACNFERIFCLVLRLARPYARRPSRERRSWS
jgi:hypothetical protein